MDQEEKEVEITYKFNLYSNADELKTFQNAGKYESALNDIHNVCRRVWKYEENPSDDKVALAEEIGNLVFGAESTEV